MDNGDDIPDCLRDDPLCKVCWYQASVWYDGEPWCQMHFNEHDVALTRRGSIKLVEKK